MKWMVFLKTIHIYITITTKDLEIYENVNISNAEYTRIILFRLKRKEKNQQLHISIPVICISSQSLATF